MIKQQINQIITLNRITAYIIDMIIITLITSLFIGLPVVNPYEHEYNESIDKYKENIFDGVDTEKQIDLLYDITIYSRRSTICITGIYFVYFALFQYLNDGATIGKRLFHLKVRTLKNKKPSFISLLTRSLIINSIITNVLMILISLSKPIFLRTVLLVELIDSAITISCIVMILVRKDNRGLHELATKTKVVYEM